MNENIIKLETTKSDKELAEELKQELFQTSQAYLDTCTKAHRLGFNVSSQFGINAFGQCVIVSLNLFKQF